MKLSQMVGKTLRETPRDASSASHVYILRGAYARPVSAGVFSLLPLGKRVTSKIANIIREEMDRIEGQEVLMPVVLPRELWEESGRYQNVGPELLRFRDRNEKEMLLGMTHEEAVVHLIRNEVNSYKQLPAMLYQIQTKYRDEARPRAGLIRVREFTMKDAYSFHTSESCLRDYYQKAHAAYVRIFDRVGLKEVLSIESDSGMMGGAVSHEFMAVADCGEDTLFVSPSGKYLANREIAKSPFDCIREEPKPLEKAHTPGQKTIADLAKFLGVSETQTGKAVFYQTESGTLVFVVIRGDLEVNETKLRNYLKEPNLAYASDEAIKAIGCVPGFASPIEVDLKNVRLIVDPSAANSSNLVVGANEVDWHYTNFNLERDLAPLKDIVQIVDIATVRESDPCPVTGEPLALKKGIEVGNIFQLGTKYSTSMHCEYLDEHGKAQPMIMGCYGIGVGRTMAAVIEQSHDDYGPIWPMSIAPYHVQLIALNYNKPEVKAAADTIYQELLEAKIEVLFEDRNLKAGVAFNDADLFGIPLRVIVSPKTLANKVVEFKRRDGSQKQELPLSGIVRFIQEQKDI